MGPSAKQPIRGWQPSCQVHGEAKGRKGDEHVSLNAATHDGQPNDAPYDDERNGLKPSDDEPNALGQDASPCNG